MSALPYDAETGEIPSDEPIVCDHPLVHAEGVYFGMPEEDYHAALALSSHGVKYLRASTLDWWARSPLNPDPDDEDDSEAKEIGTAYHKRILEGREAFYAAYAQALNPEDYPDAVRTNEELAAAIAYHGGPVKGVKGMRKAELVAMLLNYNKDAVIWETLHQEHAAQHNGKKLLSGKLIRKIETSAAMIENHPTLSKAFTGGVAEVSVFWTDAETGVPMKARLDYLKQRAVIDLKTFANLYNSPIDDAVFRAIANGRLHIQAALYLEAAEKARQAVRDNRCDGKADPEFLEAFVGGNDFTWLWVFQQKGPAPLARAYVLPPGITMDLAKHEIEQAKYAWARCWQKYGELPWVDEAEIHTVDATELPAYIAR